jgi:hypothetical protein
VLVAPKAEAQVTDVQTDRARELQKEGDAQFAKQEWAKARAAYLAAWALKKHWTVVASLGDTELRMGLHQEAAQHLSEMLTLNPPPDARAGAERMLVDAKKHVATLELRVEPAGVDVSVDGEPRGKTPLASPIFLKPGTHTVELKKVGFLSRGKTLDARPGATETLELRLEAESTGPGGGPTGPKGPEGPKPPPPPEPAPVWPTFLLGGVGVAGLGIGITLSVLSAGKVGEVEDTVDACLTPISATCLDDADALRGTAQSFEVGAIVSFVVGGLAGVGALTYALVTSSSDEPKPQVSVIPHLSPGLLGASVTGTF